MTPMERDRPLGSGPGPRYRHRRRMALTAWVILSATCLSWPSIARGQTSPRFEPVDQAVGDLDDLSTSLRRMEVGLQRHGEQTKLYRIEDPTGQNRPHYYRSGPGFRARLTRPEYLVVANEENGRAQLAINVAPYREGQFLELVPPGTVWEIDTLDAGVPPVSAHPFQATTDGAETALEGVDHRIPAVQFDYRRDTDFAPETPAAPSFLMRQVVRRKPAVAIGKTVPTSAVPPTAGPIEAGHGPSGSDDRRSAPDFAKRAAPAQSTVGRGVLRRIAKKHVVDQPDAGDATGDQGDRSR